MYTTDFNENRFVRYLNFPLLLLFPVILPTSADDEGLAIGSMPLKKCFVPSCTNTSESAPEKIFLSVPRDATIRSRWYDVVETASNLKLKRISGHYLYCCEDHLDVSFSLKVEA